MCIDISDYQMKLLIMPLPLTADGIAEPHIRCIRLIGQCIATFINLSLKGLFVLRLSVFTADEHFITVLVTVSVLYVMLRPVRNRIHLMIGYHQRE